MPPFDAKKFVPTLLIQIIISTIFISKGLNDYKCDRPLMQWLMYFAFSNIVGLVLQLSVRYFAAKGNDAGARCSFTLTFLKGVSDLVLLIFGYVWAFSATECDPELTSFVQVWLIVVSCILGVLLCCGICLCCYTQVLLHGYKNNM